MAQKEASELLKEKQLLYEWTPPCEHALTSGFIWPLGPEHYPVSLWLFLQTCPLNVQKRGKVHLFSSPLPLANKKTPRAHDSLIFRISYFLFSIKFSPTLKWIEFFILC